MPRGARQSHLDTSILLARLKSRLQAIYGDLLRGVVLYGSAARGEATPDSDVDILVLLTGPVALGWELRTIIEVLFKACEAVEESEETVLPTLRGFEPPEGYRLIGRLFQSVLRDKVAEVKAQKIKAKRRKDAEPTLFDWMGDA